MSKETNTTITLDGDDIVIRVNRSKVLGPSKSGKTNLVASTGGFVAVPGSNISLSLNVCQPK
jgi:ABC-type taurine transport system ATPase subunit